MDGLGTGLKDDRNRQSQHAGGGGESGRIAIIDIGSNTVRLVVFDAPMRLPVPLFNEKVQCELGRGLAATGRLNRSGVGLALS